jgi:calcineurin-like phosphoesterase family protein
MKYYITTDTHFGHEMLVEKGYRPNEFEDLIFTNLVKAQNIDVLVHTGDFCIGSDEVWHGDFMKCLEHNDAKKILVKGNHDKKSYSWYYDHGWDFVCERFEMVYQGKKLLFSHEPIMGHTADLNIHGHLHGAGTASHRKVEGYDPKRHYDTCPDVHDFKPVDLDFIMKRL